MNKIKTKIHIEGMECSACSSSIEHVLRKKAGILSANVNLVAKTLVCEYDSDQIKTKEIFSLIKKAGFSPSKDSNNSSTGDFFSSTTALILTIVFTVVLFLFVMGKNINFKLFQFFYQENQLILFGWIQLVLAVIVIGINYRYFTKGIKAIFKRNTNMHTLIALGSGASFLYSFVQLIQISSFATKNYELAFNLSKNLYFDSCAMILMFVHFGGWLEEKAKRKTNDAVEKLKRIVPSTVTLWINDTEKSVQIDEVQKEDVVIVHPGESFPVDGVIIKGYSHVDESFLTGESVQVEKDTGSLVKSGSMNLEGVLWVKVQEVGSNTLLSQIIDFVETAGSTKSTSSRIADQVSRIFVPVVCAISLVTLLVWLIVSKSFPTAFRYAISVLVISCPCALGLATPVTLAVAMGTCAKRGILVRSCAALESLAQLKAFVFDKTGTLTTGKMKVEQVTYQENENPYFLAIANALEISSEHPLANAIKEYTHSMVDKTLKVENESIAVGYGVSGTIDNVTYYMGNAKYLQKNGINITEKNEYGTTSIYLGSKEGLILTFYLKDFVKDTSKEALALLSKENCSLSMLTGDHQEVASELGKKLGIENVYSEVLPQDKATIVQQIQKDIGKVCFVGDGINDSPALVQADVGVAVATGSDIAMDTADLILLKSDLLDLVSARSISIRTRITIKENLFWALLYNSICIPLASGVFAFMGVQLNPMIAALCMSLSSLFVVGNALRMNIFYKNEKRRKK